MKILNKTNAESAELVVNSPDPSWEVYIKQEEFQQFSISFLHL